MAANSLNTTTTAAALAAVPACRRGQAQLGMLGDGKALARRRMR
jgi:hypothetical protein